MLTSNTSKPKTRRPRWLTSLLPRAYSSLYSRLLLVMALAVGGSFFLATSIWLASMHSEKESDALLSVEDLAISMAQTVLYFEGLPKTYQHIILDQQRNLGGSRFFLSVNEERIEYETIEDNPLKTRLISAYETAFRDRVGVRVREIDVNFAYPDKLRVFNKDVLFSELPSRWVQNNLVLNPPAPLLVAQMQMSNGDWLYLASLMLPDPYVVEGIPPFTHEQLVFTLILSFILMLSSWFIVRWMTAPLRQLSEAASLLGRDIHQVPVPEKGTFEVRETARAFNLMQRRILAFISERNLLFSAISHDLKTPITRLRLRSELLDDPEARTKINQDLSELEHLVQGALELARGSDLNEPTSRMDVNALVHAIQEEVAVLNKTVHIDAPAQVQLIGRPIAFKRCLSNLIHNAVFYGSEAWITLNETPDAFLITILDNGPGVPEEELAHIFEPFVRLETSRNRNTGGHGLGMTIARNIVHTHGGSIQLKNEPGMGLKVDIQLDKA